MEGDARWFVRDLGLYSLVSGGLDCQGDQIQTNVPLIDVETRAICRTERFETPLAKLQSTQCSVANRITNTLLVQLVARESSRLETYTDESRRR